MAKIEAVNYWHRGSSAVRGLYPSKVMKFLSMVLYGNDNVVVYVSPRQAKVVAGNWVEVTDEDLMRATEGVWHYKTATLYGKHRVWRLVEAGTAIRYLVQTLSFVTGCTTHGEFATRIEANALVAQKKANGVKCEVRLKVVTLQEGKTCNV